MVEARPMRSAICCPIPCVTKKSEMSSLGFMIKGSRLKVKGERISKNKVGSLQLAVGRKNKKTVY